MGVISHGKHACYSSPNSFGHPSELAFFLFVLLQLIFSRLAFSRAITLLDCSCERAFHPVCGTDQQTYDSRCFLDCARRYDQELMLAYEGVCCPKAELCADYLDPVCDQMGNFYENDCIFDFHKCIQRRTGGGLPLLRVVGRGKMCTRRPPAVAAAGTRLGGGGQRPNHHHQQPQQQNKNATGQRFCDFFCDEVVTPVCDSQGRTHKNRCKFDLASCRLRSRGIVSALHILREGPCHKEDNNFGQFPNGSSIHRMSLANMMEGIRRERARKRLNLPSKTSAQETAESSETGRRQSAEPATEEPNNQSGNGKAPLVGDWSGEREREEEKEKEAADTGNQQSGEQIPEIPASRFFRDQQQQQTMTMARVNSSSLPERRWQLSQAQNQQIISEQSTTAFSPTSARPWSREEMTFTNKNCPPASECPQLWDPLCDSHNRTHANECHFAIARCQFARIASRSEQPPKMAHRGKCSKIPTSSSQQPMASKCDFCREENSLDQIVPVCDNTNLTHQSVCLFAQWNCAKRLRRAEEHVLGHVGECSLISPIFELKDEVCPAKCSRHFKPVCDSDGLTHPNLCAYQMFSCHQRKEGQPFGWLISLRECNQTDNNKSGAEVVDRGPAAARRAAAIECPEEPNCEGQPLADGDGPICDSEGRIHKNSCWFAHAHCMAAKMGKALRIVEDQNCPQLAAEERPTAPADDGQRQVAANCEQRWPNCAGTAVDPYCGSDFISYRNLCAIQKAHCMDGRVEILFKGECEKCLAEPCTPPNPADDLQFVCDQSGETKSVCEFQMLRCIYEAKFGYNITAAHQGHCCPGADACSMAAENSSEVDPVCDSQGRRHANHCLFKVAKCRAQKIAGQQLQERQCSDTENAKERQPSIGSGSTQRPSTAGPEFPAMPNEAAEVLAPEAMEAYGGVAEHQLQNTASPKPAEPTNPPKSNGSAELASQQHSCSNRYEPMCGSDRRTYRNGCLLLERRNASSSTRVSPPVRLLYPGECCPAPETCGPDHSPVCDNQGNTHLNLCEFGRQRCLAERIWAQNLTIVAYTMCPSLRCPRDKCPSRYEPVCATSGRTYANLCELDKSVCVLRSGLQGHFAAHPDNGTNEAERSSLALDYIGECCETAIECGEIVDPENGGPTAGCDNLGRSHRSECAFRRAACLARKREGQTLRPVQCPPSQSRNSQRQKQS